MGIKQAVDVRPELWGQHGQAAVQRLVTPRPHSRPPTKLLQGEVHLRVQNVCLVFGEFVGVYIGRSWVHVMA